MIIDKNAAKAILFAAAETSQEESVDPTWQQMIENFSRICDETTRTHVAFLGTAILAKATDLAVDVWAVKARNEEQGAYSVRSLGHGVLVPNAPVLGINLGVTGREPLNNQPYFRIMRVSRDIPVHSNARPAIAALCDILEILSAVTSVNDARRALQAFIFVRRQWNPTYNRLGVVATTFNLQRLITAVQVFVSEDSEGGKRAQAVVAGFMDLYVGSARVITSKINDPDRHLPGDIGILAAPAVEISATVSEVRDDVLGEPEGYVFTRTIALPRWAKVFEVRDKPVADSDLYHFSQKAMEHKVNDGAVVAVAPSQQAIDEYAVREWASTRGVSLTLFRGWDTFIRQLLFWSDLPSAVNAQRVPTLIHSRLIELEVSHRGVDLWSQLITAME